MYQLGQLPPPRVCSALPATALVMKTDVSPSIASLGSGSKPGGRPLALKPYVAFRPEVDEMVGSRSITVLPTSRALAHSSQCGVELRLPRV